MSRLEERLDQLRQRLLAANLRSRSIRLRKPTRSGAFDLYRLASLAPQALRKLLLAMGRPEQSAIPLIPVKGDDEAVRDASEDLRRLSNAAHRTWMEVGENELLLGWPFIEAKLDSTWIRAPLLLYPVTLTRTRRGRLTWKLTLTERPDVNEVLAQSLFRLAGARLEFERLVEIDEDHLIQPDPPTWQSIRGWLVEGGLTPAEMGPDPIEPEPLRARSSDERDDYPEGQVELRNHLVLGRFPQSSSNVLNEYNELTGRPELLGEGPAAELLAIDPGTVPNFDAVPTLEQPVGEAENAEAAPADGDEAEGFRVLPSDASQEAVIQALDRLDGRGLVVRGPPGTGKSQLIANLVGQGVQRGQRVLVVCQKRAALDVVEQRLGSVGLAEPLALVHDVHQDRQTFCAKLSGTLETVIEPADRGSSDELERAERRVVTRFRQAKSRFDSRLRAGRDAYRAMMARGPGGRPLAELLERALDDDGRPLPDLSAAVEDVNEETAIAALPDVESSARDARRLAAPHALTCRTDWAKLDDDALVRLKGQLEGLRQALLACHADESTTMTPGEARAHAALWSQTASLLDLFESAEEGGRNQFALYWHFTDAGRQDSAFRLAVERLETARDELGNVPAGLVDADGMTVLDWIAELDELAELRARWWRFIIPRFWRLRGRPAAIMAAAGMAPSEVPVKLVDVCRMALGWHELIREVGELLEEAAFVSFGCRGQLDDIDRFLAELRTSAQRVEQLQALHAELRSVHPDYAELPGFDPERSGDYADLPFFGAALADRELASRMARAERAASDLAFAIRPGWLAERLATAAAGEPDAAPLDAALNVWDDAPAAAELDRRLAHLPEWGREFLRFYRQDDPFDPSRLADDAMLAVERGWRGLALAGRTLQQAEAALVEESQRTALAAAYDETVELSGPAVLAGYRAYLREAAAHPELGRAMRRLLHEARKKRYRRTIRQLIEAYWDEGLSVARPIWLCSPESVAALFPLKAAMFDLVVMDEASQCPVESALPALIRGRRVVVAGDEKQMPPSHFFTSRDDDEDLDEDEPSTLLAAESILDLSHVAYPGAMLRFHYRSRHEELITFSNHAFYGGRLVTAPPAERTTESFEGVHYLRTEGLWDNQTNRIEAERAVDLVLDLLGRTRPGSDRRLSAGVVTFNQKQRALVEELLDLRTVSDERAREVLGGEWERDPTEALFVKNIENVQGDERDVIVFSTGYGPPRPGGRVAARFGPVGQDGGEHRLNVAITRAKFGVHLITSFEPAQLDTRNTKNLGPKLLERYLHYVERADADAADDVQRILAEVAALSEEGSAARVGGPPADRIGLRVREALAGRLDQLGLHVARDFGIGPYRLDLAVRRSRDEANWACGIDCTRFLATPDTIQRDVTEPAFWARAGWTIFRVSPALWLERREEVIDRVVEVVG